MAQLLNSLHGPLFLNNPSSRDSPSNALTSLQHHLFISRGNYAEFQKCRGVQSSSQGNWEVLDHVEKCPLQCEANVGKGGELEVLPHIQTLRKYPKEDLSGKVVLVRFDSTILLREQLDAKARSVSNALFTITYLYEAGAKVILVSDWSSKIDSKLLAADFVSDFLSSVLKLKVVPARCISVYVLSKMDEFKKADILLLENLSEFKEELANCSKFAEKLSSGVDIFVNESFSQSHKVLASTVGIARFCYASVAGFHFEEGLYQLNKAAKTSGLPYVAIVGGGNLYEKAAALQFLTSRCNGLVFVGMMAFQIMHALGLPVPLNLVEHGALKEALNLIQLARYKKIPLLYPKDFWCMNISLRKQLQIFPAHGILDGWVPVDLGPNSLDEISSLLTKCKKIIWIGPMKFRWSSKDTNGASKLMLMLDKLGQSNCDITVVGTMACKAVMKESSSVSVYNMVENATVVWEFLKGRKLPGLMALDRVRSL
ncbi:hypothetical protein L1049_016728 [Liquidambar formosana]|uniref:Phosphoglycerate kinase n=1 Tax=Liquidambar formosana TaxID=63359 RepID=A0AAP0X3M9_LIQFO